MLPAGPEGASGERLYAVGGSVASGRASPAGVGQRGGPFDPATRAVVCRSPWSHTVWSRATLSWVVWLGGVTSRVADGGSQPPPAVGTSDQVTSVEAVPPGRSTTVRGPGSLRK